MLSHEAGGRMLGWGRLFWRAVPRCPADSVTACPPSGITTPLLSRTLREQPCMGPKVHLQIVPWDAAAHRCKLLEAADVS